MTGSVWSHCKQNWEEMGTSGSYEFVWVDTSIFVTPLHLRWSPIYFSALIWYLLSLSCSSLCIDLLVLYSQYFLFMFICSNIDALALVFLVLPQITANTVHSLSSGVYWNITLGSPPKRQPQPKEFPCLHILFLLCVYQHLRIYLIFLCMFPSC